MAKLLKIEKDVEAIIKSKPVGLYKVEQKRKRYFKKTIGDRIKDFRKEVKS